MTQITQTLPQCQKRCKNAEILATVSQMLPNISQEVHFREFLDPLMMKFYYQFTGVSHGEKNFEKPVSI